MDFEKLTQYVRDELQKGTKPDDVKKALLAGGWTAPDIDKALIASQSVPAIAAKPAPVSTVREVSFPAEKEVERVEKVARAARGAQSGESFHKFNFSLRFILSYPYVKPALITAGIFIVLGGGGYAGYRYLISHWTPNGQVAAPPPAPAPQPVVTIDENAELFRKLFSLKLATTTHENKTVVYPFVDETNTVTVKGTLGDAFVSNAVRYAVYDIPSGLFIPIANSSDEKIDAALKPLLGKEVTVSGTHMPGSREITVISVNGNPL